MILLQRVGQFLGLILLPFVFCACPTLMTRTDVKEVEQKKNMQDSVVNLQKANADVTNRFVEIEQDARQLTGRLEVLENKQNQAKENSESVRRAQEEKIQVLTEQIQSMQQELVRFDTDLAKLNSAVENGALNSKAADKPDDPFATAEKFFEAKDWKKAILAYNKYRDANPKAKKFAEATYKIGVSFQELGLKDEAKSFYEEVLSKYPSSPEARKCKTRLKGLK